MATLHLPDRSVPPVGPSKDQATALSGVVSPEDDRAHGAIAPADRGIIQRLRGQLGAEPLARRRFFTDTADKWLFGVFAAAGFLATFVAHWMGLRGLGSELPPLVLLAGYAGVSWSIEWFRLHPDRLGDNCYYMGFLFTLAALSTALVAVQTGAADASGNMLEGLIGSFGVALFSTIGGITLRVIFMQMRREVEDVEQEIRSELQEAARKLKDELGAAISDLESFRLRTQQLDEEQRDSVLAGLGRTSEEFARHLVESGNAHAAAQLRLTTGSQEAMEKLASAVVGMAGQVQTAGVAHVRAARRLADSSDKIVTEVARLTERVEAIDVPDDLLTRQVEAARQRIDALASALDRVSTADATRQGAIEKAAASLDRLLSRMAALPAFEAIEASTSRLQVRVEAAGEAMHGFSENLTGQSRVFETMVTTLRKDSQAIADLRNSIDTDVRESEAALTKLRVSLTDVADKLVEHLGES